MRSSDRSKPGHCVPRMRGRKLQLIALRMGREERMMIDEFGGPYRQYMQTTGRFIPRIRFSRGTPSTKG